MTTQTHTPPTVEVADIASAEKWVEANPKCGHGFATCATVEFGTGIVRHPIPVGATGEDYRLNAEACRRTREAAPAREAAALQALRDAGYRYSAERERWERDGYWAEASGYDSSPVRVYVYRDGEWPAWACGYNGWLPSDSRPGS